MAMWDTFTSRIVIEAELKAVTAIRVGAGGDEAAQPSASDLPVLVGADGRPYIPGSSLRGVLRSQIERFARTLEEEPGGGRGACYPTNEKQWCVTAEMLSGNNGNTGWRQKARDQDDADAWLAQKIWDTSCRVCRTFGSAWLASRVRIADLPFAQEGRAIIERRDGVAIDRDKETVQHKYDFETLPPQTAFHLRIVGENLDAHERGLLWLGLRELIDGHILLGGFKGRGLGRVTLNNLKIQCVDNEGEGAGEALRRYILHKELTDVSVEQLDGWLNDLMDTVEVGG